MSRSKDITRENTYELEDSQHLKVAARSRRLHILQQSGEEAATWQDIVNLTISLPFDNNVECYNIENDSLSLNDRNIAVDK